MTRVEILREQASILRSVLRDNLLGLAKRCEERAAEAEREITQSKARAVGAQTAGDRKAVRRGKRGRG